LKYKFEFCYFPDKIKPGSLLRIAAQCADFYNDAQKLMAKENIRGIWEKVSQKYI
jgi:hypothetical protein